MAVEYGVNQDQGIFKGITTERAIYAFDTVLNKDMTKVILGELNYENEIFKHVNILPIDFSVQIQNEIKNLNNGSKKVSKQKEKTQVKVTIKGRSNGEYTETERKLAQVWSQTLEMEEINIYDDFYNLGGDSIIAIKITNIVNEYLNIQLSISDLFEHITIAELAQYLDEQDKEDKEDKSANIIEKNPKSENEVYDLSNAQRRLWFMQKANPQMNAYNLPAMWHITFEPDIEQLQKALNMLINRQQALRIVFREENGISKQIILDTLDLKIDVIDLSSEDNKENLWKELMFEDNKISFDLTKPLVRAKLYKLDQKDYHLYLNFHHIITDGWSMRIVYEELMTIYTALLNGKEANLKSLKLSYIDWVQKQNEWLQSSNCKEVEEYWLNELIKPLPVLNLPIDYSRPERQTYNGNFYVYTMSQEQTDKLKEISKKLNSTLHVFLLSAYILLLNKISADEDIVVGIPITGRDNKELENIIGLFVNSICIRVNFEKLTFFRDLLNQVREKSLHGYKNSKYPFDLLVNKVNPARDQSRNPIFSTLFQYYDIIPLENDQISLFDISLACREAKEGTQVRIEYNVDLFKKDTIEKIAHNFVKIVDQVIENQDIQIRDVDLDVEYKIVKSAPIDELEFNF